jgi:hypothetical protein
MQFYIKKNMKVVLLISPFENCNYSSSVQIAKKKNNKLNNVTLVQLKIYINRINDKLLEYLFSEIFFFNGTT